MIRALVLALPLLALGLAPAFAHKPSDSYLSLKARGSGLDVQWDIALRDLDFAVGLDQNDDGAVTWGEIRQRAAAIDAYALSRLSIRGDGALCPFGPVTHLIDRHSDGAYAVLRFRAGCAAAPRKLAIAYDLLFDEDFQHRGLLSLDAGGKPRLAVFSREARSQRFDLRASGGSALATFVREGFAHVMGGYDHLLFMAVMLLPAMLRRRGIAWEPTPRLAPALLDTFKIVTAFTLAHATTLTLVVLNYVAIPSRIVEAGVAVSIALGAIDNFRPILGERRWLVAFGFGLIHGAGYASILAALNLTPGPLAVALFGFNIGVELAQLVVAAVVFPVGFLLRNLWLYTKLVVPLGSGVALALATLWFVERAFDIKLTLASMR